MSIAAFVVLTLWDWIAGDEIRVIMNLCLAFAMTLLSFVADRVFPQASM